MFSCQVRKIWVVECDYISIGKVQTALVVLARKEAVMSFALCCNQVYQVEEYMCNHSPDWSCNVDLRRHCSYSISTIRKRDKYEREKQERNDVLERLAGYCQYIYITDMNCTRTVQMFHKSSCYSALNFHSIIRCPTLPSRCSRYTDVTELS